MTLLDLALRDPEIAFALSIEGIYISHVEHSTVLSYHLSDEVVSPTRYVKVLELARLLDEDDVFEIVISGSPGGFLSGARVLTTAQNTTEATTTAVVIDHIASAATMVALNADTLIMTEGSSMMIHSASYGSAGKASDVAAHVKFSTEDITRTIKEFYNGFFSKKEMKKVLAGKEYYFHADECLERFEKISKRRDKQAKKQQKLAMLEQREMMQVQLEMIDAMLEEDS